MAIFVADKGVLLVKSEGANYGVDAAPVAADFIIAQDIKVDLAGIELKRDALLPVEGKMPSEMYEGAAKISFKTHLFATATPSNSHPLEPLFTAASMPEGAVSGVNQYLLTVASDGATGSVTIYFYHGGRLYKLLGMCGSLKATCKVGELIELEWNFDGHWTVAGISDTAFPSLSGATMPGSPVRFAGATFSVNDLLLTVANCTIDFGQKVVGRKDPAGTNGIGRYWVESIGPKASIDPQAEALATHNPWTDASTKVVGDLVLDVVVATVHHKISVTSLQLMWPKPGERDGLQTYAIEGVARATDEETTFTAFVQFDITGG